MPLLASAASQTTKGPEALESYQYAKIKKMTKIIKNKIKKGEELDEDEENFAIEYGRQTVHL